MKILSRGPCSDLHKLDTHQLFHTGLDPIFDQSFKDFRDYTCKKDFSVVDYDTVPMDGTFAIFGSHYFPYMMV